MSCAYARLLLLKIVLMFSNFGWDLVLGTGVDLDICCSRHCGQSYKVLNFLKFWTRILCSFQPSTGLESTKQVEKFRSSDCSKLRLSEFHSLVCLIVVNCIFVIVLSCATNSKLWHVCI